MCLILDIIKCCRFVRDEYVIGLVMMMMMNADDNDGLLIMDVDDVIVI